MGQSNTDVEESSDPGTLAQIRWEATRQAWLQPRPLASTSHTLSSKPKSLSGAKLLRSGDEKCEAERREKFMIAFERMTFFYDEQAKLGHENGSARQAIIQTAQQLKDQNRIYTVPVPLRHAVAIFYRSWFHDGTIPEGHPFLACQPSSTSESESDSTGDEGDPTRIYHCPSEQVFPTPLAGQSPSSAPPHLRQFPNTISSSSSSLPSSSLKDCPFHMNLPQESTSREDIKLTKVYLTRP
ncbi:hypothetical protein CROQUDRAFT_651015 [Cronartium quercuum f. sp. fusiforme G11]|uniref:Uncharacterized protein n=1 Tax=Cronartium quercuum f. sp. fusiforme G11 TaxID=708437 RepID=A0A9P6NQN9_9BASI|nr:hypothetical protein CROQUDRAFT_651015 [Cronartium quercuum f. sp. fusiforme G11]